MLSTDAPDTLNTIRAQLHDAKCPILILYPPNAVYDRADYFRAGAADAVEATCDLREILSRLRSAMRRATAAREVALRSGTTRALGFAEAGSTFAAKQMIHVLQMTGRTPPAVTLPNFAVQSVVFDDLGALGERQALKCLIIDVDRDAPRRVIPPLLDLRTHPATRYASLFFLLLVAIAVLTLGHVTPGGGQDLLQNRPQGPRHGAVELQGDFNLAILAGELPVVFEGRVEGGVEEGLVVGHDTGILVFVGLGIVVIRILRLLLGQRFGKDGGVGVHPAEVAVHVLEHLGVRLPLFGGHDDQRHRLTGFGLLGLLLISASSTSTSTRRVLELVGVAAAKVLEEAGQAEAGSGPAVGGEVADPLEEVLPK